MGFLPEGRKLYENIRTFHASLYQPRRGRKQMRSSGHNIFNINSNFLNITQKINKAFLTYNNWIVEKIAIHYDFQQNVNKIYDREVLIQSFVNKCENKKFINDFMHTQHFTMYAELVLKE